MAEASALVGELEDVTGLSLEYQQSDQVYRSKVKVGNTCCRTQLKTQRPEHLHEQSQQCAVTDCWYSCVTIYSPIHIAYGAINHIHEYRTETAELHVK